MLSLTAITTSVKTVHTMLDAWLAQLQQTHNLATLPTASGFAPSPAHDPASPFTIPGSTLLTDLERAAGILYRLTAIQKTVVSLEKQAAVTDRAYIRDLYHGVVALERLMNLTRTNPARARRTPLPPLDPRLTEPLTRAGREKRRGRHKPYDRDNPQSHSAKLNADERRLGLTLRQATTNLVAAKSPTDSLAASIQAHTPHPGSADISVCTDSTPNPHGAPAESPCGAATLGCDSNSIRRAAGATTGGTVAAPASPDTRDANPNLSLSTPRSPFPRAIPPLPDHLNPDHQPNLLAGIDADLQCIHAGLTDRLYRFFKEMPDAPDHLPPAARHKGIEPLTLPEDLFPSGNSPDESAPQASPHDFSSTPRIPNAAPPGPPSHSMAPT